MNNQKGVGLIEVLVALILLAIAVLGFTALQVRAISASIDAGNTTQATSLAKDLAERIRINRDGYAVYTATSTYTGGASSKDCASVICTASEMAQFDFDQVDRKAESLGMDIAINDCQGSTLSRKCIYVAWDDTTPTDGEDPEDEENLNCTNGVAYVPGSKCIMMEIYNYD